MKSLNYALLILLISIVFTNLKAQQALGDCDRVTVTEIPSYPTVYVAKTMKNCTSSCCKIVFSSYNQLKPQLWLEKLNSSGDWLTVKGPLYGGVGKSFTNLDPISDHGTYRVKILTPYYNENTCTNSQTRIELFNQIGQFLGYLGTYDNTPYGGNNTYYTNSVIVGPSNANDIVYTFIDSPETGSEMAYDFGEKVKIDFSNSKNYNTWFLAVFEDGPTYDRYQATGWSAGSIDEFDLSDFWNRVGWQFETFHSYTVQVALENLQCRNAIEYTGTSTWNNKDRSFFICPTGSGCRFAANKKDVIIDLGPNPANTFIQLHNFDPDVDLNYQMQVFDISGKLIKAVQLTDAEVDISDLSSGMFIVKIYQGGNEIFQSKLIVSN